MISIFVVLLYCPFQVRASQPPSQPLRAPRIRTQLLLPKWAICRCRLPLSTTTYVYYHLRLLLNETNDPRKSAIVGRTSLAEVLTLNFTLRFKYLVLIFLFNLITLIINLFIYLFIFFFFTICTCILNHNIHTWLLIFILFTFLSTWLSIIPYHFIKLIQALSHSHFITYIYFCFVFLF